jgi:predicted  nucleic acid-binding Zn-ribbon protein
MIIDLGNLVSGIFGALGVLVSAWFVWRKDKKQREEQEMNWQFDVNTKLDALNQSFEKVENVLTQHSSSIQANERQIHSCREELALTSRDVKNEYKSTKQRMDDYMGLIKEIINPIKGMQQQLDTVVGDVAHIRELFDEKITTLARDVSVAHTRIDKHEQRLHKQ